MTAALLAAPLALTPADAAPPARKAITKPAPRKPVAPRPALARPLPDGELAPGAWRWLSEGPWNGPLSMVISIEKQMVHVYMGDTLIGMASVSTGMKGHSTPTGQFPILQKRQWHRSNIYSNAPMPYMQRLTWDGIALHAGHNPGRPASHGCIRLPLAFAKRLFELTQLGTLVSVQRGEISPVLALDPLILTDPGSTIVTFTPRAAPTQIEPPAPDMPRLDIDPEIFRLRLSSGRRY
ncbi:L,D-transpeptidase family protein [Sphingobium aromaticiconvertens]|uniref:L,D-transpeptidase family protein n=1 Tax=Sphingobium aromaticiconvertens TaxID=365341 RepID=UPI0030198985